MGVGQGRLQPGRGYGTAPSCGVTPREEPGRIQQRLAQDNSVPADARRQALLLQTMLADAGPPTAPGLHFCVVHRRRTAWGLHAPTCWPAFASGYPVRSEDMQTRIPV